jgi:hypothetical protein
LSSAWIDSHSAQIRAALYGGLGLAVVANIVTSVGQDQLSVRSVILPVLLVAGLAVVAELGFGLVRPRAHVVFAGSQSSLLKKMTGDLSELMRESKDILILGQTLTSFTGDAENREALKAHLKKMAKERIDHPERAEDQLETKLRILMLRPDSDGREVAQKARNHRLQASRSNFESEIETSIQYLLQIGAELKTGAEPTGGKKREEHVRLYEQHPTFSLYKCDSTCVVTIYTLGHGASSPAFLFRSVGRYKEFSDTLIRGFDELWAASDPEKLVPLESTRSRGLRE